MRVEEINNKEIWEEFLRSVDIKNKTFLQSWQWGEFEKAMGHRVWRLGVYHEKSKGKSQKANLQVKSQKLENNGELLAVAQVIKVEALRGKHLLIPHGPIIQSKISNLKSKNHNLNLKTKILKSLISKLKEIAKQEKCAFIRVAPVWERGVENEKFFKELGFKQAAIHTHPELTWVLDLKPSEDELLMNMRKTTRYLIRQGLKNPDLEIVKSKNVEDVGVFDKIYQETAQRHQFVPFSSEYLKKEFLAFIKDNQVLIFLAKYKSEAIAAAIVIYWQGIGFYHQGASSQKHRKAPASYLLQWEAIREARSRGCRLYNFWGIAEQKSKIRQHPWKGLTLFKMGFGGYPLFYVKTQDLPLSKKYWLTHIFEQLRRKKRGF